MVFSAENHPSHHDGKINKFSTIRRARPETTSVGKEKTPAEIRENQEIIQLMKAISQAATEMLSDLNELLNN